MKKIVSIIAAAIVASTSVFCISANAVSYPQISSEQYIEFKAQNDIKVYKDNDCDVRGTCSPSKKYNAYIEDGDICRIYKITDSYIKVNYPTSSGRRTGYIKRSALFDDTEAVEYISDSKAKVDVSKSTSGSYIAKGDEVWRVDPKKEYSGYYAVIYEAKSGDRAYKLGYITADGLNSIKKAVSADNSMTNALYGLNTSSSKISCGFDGYVSTSGRHEGIDFDYSNGKTIYSLTNGVVTNVVEGQDGGKLSTIAIYDSANDKTVIYLHSNPSNSLYVGKNINKGDAIGTESWRGCSSSGGGHTHVEVRSGYRTNAAKSVNDGTLDNSNPRNYWNSLGYTVK